MAQAASASTGSPVPGVRNAQRYSAADLAATARGKAAIQAGYVKSDAAAAGVDATSVAVGAPPAAGAGTAAAGAPGAAAGSPGATGAVGAPGATGAPAATGTPSQQAAITGLQSDIAAGKTYMGDTFKEGSMGRVSDTTSAAQADALAKEQALEGGLTGPAMRARQEQADQSIGAQEQANMMQLQGIQGNQGLRGASAGAQQTGLLYNALSQQQSANRQLTLDDLAAKQSGLANFVRDNGNNDAFNRSGTEYNDHQRNAETAGRLSTPLTYASLIQGARTGADANDIARQGANTATASAKAAAALAQATFAQSRSDALGAKGTAADDAEKEYDSTHPGTGAGNHGVGT